MGSVKKKSMSFDDLLRYTHSLDVKVTFTSASWSQFKSLENCISTKLTILNDYPEEAYRLQQSRGVIRWYRIDLQKRAGGYGHRYAVIRTLGMLADSDQDFLEAVAYHMATSGPFLTTEEANAL